ncbi:Translocon-associated protein, delta subunit precursor (TRAP-delta) [Popillia japonica]|uniref:Translocon-associated protein subunit delta n=1 Tax=Popillia japonica TaxID=7064 RepID=A0AAW1J008_POPJA
MPQSISNLYADIDGNIQPVSLIDPNTYQVSWTEEIATARSGERIVNLFDEEGYTALRKAIRNGDDVSKISELFSITVNHPGAFTGPWLKSEFLAAILSVVVAYIAFSSRSKLLS